VVLFSTGLATFAVFLDTTIGFVSFPAISQTFHSAGAATLSWVLNAYTLVFATVLIPCGRLADRVGRKRMFLLGATVFTIGSMACGLSPNISSLIAAEMLEAVGAAILVPASLALVLQTFPRDQLPRAVAIWGAIGAVAGAAGPTIGSIVVSNFGWRWAFFINLPVGIVSVLLARRVLPEGREANPGPLPDPVGLLLLGGGVAAVTLSLVKSAEWGWGSTRQLAWAGAGLVGVAWFARRSTQVPHPVVRPALFRHAGFRWANVGTLVYAIGFNAMFLGNILFLTRVWHYSILRAGLAVSLGPLVVAATAPRFGRLAGRIGQRRLLVPGGLVWAAGGAYLLARATTTPDYPGVYLPAVVMTGLGVALCLPQLSSAAVQSLPRDEFATGSAVGQALRNLGATVGVALVIAFTTDIQSTNALAAFHRAWWLLVTCGVIVSLVSTRLQPGVAAAATAAGHG
jgi:EmrB/QacA subfamily drug resistance transporter